MVKAVFFDMGGVLIRLELEKAHEAFRRDVGFQDIDKYLNNYHQEGFLGELECGRITKEDFYAECKRHCNPGTTDEMIKDCLRNLVPGFNPGVVSLIDSLRERYDIYMLSNNNPIAMEILGSMFDSVGLPLATSFKKAYCSYEMKMLKPGREIYEKVMEETGLKPEEILFIDDAAANIRTADELGWNTVLYDVDTDITRVVTEALGKLS